MKIAMNENTRVKIAIYKPKITLIKKTVAEYLGLTLQEVEKHGRIGSSIKARQWIQYLSRDLLPPGCSLSIIGLLTGNGKAFDHSTVLYSCKTVKREMTLKKKDGGLVYPDVEQDIIFLRTLIKRKIFAVKNNRIRNHYRAMSHKSRRLRLQNIPG